MKKFLTSVLLLASMGSIGSVVTNVVARQLQPWNGLVEIRYELNEALSSVVPFEVTAYDGSTGEDCLARTICPALGRSKGKHCVVWNAKKDNCRWKSSQVVFRVGIPDYYIIDLSAGDNATSYPVTCRYGMPSEGWDDEYKTTKLVLRRIDPGSYIMGGGSDESHRVTLTKPFFVGVFPVTQKQWTLVMGANPSHFSGSDMLPVEQVSYDMIRGTVEGSKWPASAAVDDTSFLGKLRARSGLLGLDLPTDAQWEYACRAGTVTTYFWGDSWNDDYGWCANNSSNITHEVGTKLPNAWGLYDFSGNVLEWCLDWQSVLVYGCDPVGGLTGTVRFRRGGYCLGADHYCSSSYHSNANPSNRYICDSFRLCMHSVNPSN